MLVILRENVENLGTTGDVVRVSPGYARNFLIPRKLVVIADEGNVKAIEAQKKALAKRRMEQKGAAEELAKKLGGQKVTISRKVGENDKIFGSVSANDIADELAKAGYKIDKRTIQINQPIKALGDHTVTLKLTPEVSGTLNVSVVRDEA